MLRIDPATGATIFSLPNPVSYAKPYGLAFDRFTGAQDPYLWFAEPWSYGQFRLSQVNVWDGLIYHTIDVTAALARPDSCLSGGLEIIDNHPDYPGKIIAVAVEQKTNSILFVDITGTPLPDRILLQNRASIGGWLHRAMVENNFLYEFRAHDLNILDLADNKRKRSSRLLPSEPQNGLVFNDFLYLYYPGQNENFNKRIEFINVSNKDRPFIAGWYTTTRILSRGIMKLAVSSVAGGGDFLIVLTQQSTSWGALEKILLFELPSPGSLVYKSELSADIVDIAAAGNYVYVLLKTPQQKLTVYEISNNSFIERGSIAIADLEKITVAGDYAYVACTNLQGLKVIDISDPQSPFEAAAFGNGVYSFYDDMLLSNNPTAFLKTTDFDIVAVDISNPLTPAELANFNPDGVGNFKFSGYYANSLFLTDSGSLYEVDYTIPAAPSIALGVFEPSIIRGNTAFDNKLYSVGNDKLWVYDVDETGVPIFNSSIDIAKADKIFNDGNYLFVCDRDNLLNIYDASLQLVGSFDAGAPVMDAATRNNTLYLALYNSTDLKIVDYGNPAAPSEITTFTLFYPGTALSLSENSNTLFVASNNGDGSGNEQGYFQVIDVSDAANPVLLSDQQIAVGNKIHNLHPAGNLLFTGGSSGSDGLIEVFDVSDPANPARIKASPFLDSPLADIAYFRGYVFAALPDAGSMISYRWDASLQEFFPGPSAAMPEPVEITLFTRTPAFSSNSLLKSFGDEPKTYAVVNNGPKYQQSTEGSKGTKLTEIVVYPPHEPQKVDLTMAVEPPEAAEAGCSTIPAPGSHRYNKGAHVNLMAVPNQEQGWFFKEWTGDASGKDLIVGVTMDRDKIATAHFEELMLTVSGTEDKRVYCASQINEEKKFVILPVTLCASEVDDWTVSRINFKSSGTGDEAADIEEVNVFKAGVNIYNGKYANDNGVIQANFQPPINIQAGECVTIYFNYDFSTLDINSYASDQPKTFLVETGAVIAKPDHYESGLIAGKAQIDTFSIGRVYNSKKVVFSQIQ
ncbi:MAG TPA: hypothetical protein ENN22_14995, partial [bacterium]|nr:hypothetical protein [bacterium]